MFLLNADKCKEGKLEGEQLKSLNMFFIKTFILMVGKNYMPIRSKYTKISKLKRGSTAHFALLISEENYGLHQCAL